MQHSPRCLKVKGRLESITAEQQEHLYCYGWELVLNHDFMKTGTMDSIRRICQNRIYSFFNQLQKIAVVLMLYIIEVSAIQRKYWAHTVLQLKEG